MVPKKKRVSTSSKSGLQFPVARIKRYLKEKLFGARIGKSSSIYLTAVLEYLMAEILEISGNCALEKKKKIIKERHILLAIKNDPELKQLLMGTTISGAGVHNEIHP